MSGTDSDQACDGMIAALGSRGYMVQINLSGVELMTSGFSDELFGVLWDENGDLLFKSVQFVFPEIEDRASLLKAVINKLFNLEKFEKIGIDPR